MKRTGTSTDGKRTLRVSAAIIALLAVGVRLYVLHVSHTTTEDFFITLRYARNLAAGRGFVYNPGEHVLGATSPLYTLLLAGFYRLGLDAGLAGKALNILADAGVCIGLCIFFDGLGQPRAGRIAALLYAATSAPVNFACGGMETGLVSLAEVLAIGAYAALKEKALWAWLAVLVLLRIDGLALGAVLLIALKLGRRPMHWQAALPPSAVVGAWVAFAWVYFGSPLPNSVVAKLVAYGHLRSAGALPNLPEFVTQFAKGPFQMALLAAFAWGAVFAWTRMPAMRPPLVWMFLYYGVMLASRVPAFGWYFVPGLPVYYGVAAVGMASAVSRLEASLTRRAGVGRCGATLEGLLGAVLLAHVPAVARDVARAQALEDQVRRPIGQWLAGNTRPSDRVLLEPLGYIGYYSGRPMIDAVGIVSPQVLRFYRAGSRDPLADMIAAFHPEYVLLGRGDVDRLGLMGSMKGDVDIRSRYHFVRAWPDARSGPVYFLFRRNDYGAAAHRNIRRPLQRPIRQRLRPHPSGRAQWDHRGNADPGLACRDARVEAEALQVPVATGGGSCAVRLLEGLLGSEKPLLLS
ncbi:MAG: hypothetical protein ACP5VE_08980 [Chthonomonadales bacterium]